MDRWLDRHWVWVGAALGILFPLGYAQLPDVGLSALSIFFGGLLAISSLIPCIQNYEKIKFIKESGHMKDLLDYISLPLRLSFLLIVLELTSQIIIVPTNMIYTMIFSVVSLSLWGIFICSLFRILLLVPKLIENSK